MLGVYLSLGSNLGEPRKNLLSTLELLKEKITIQKKSALYETKPYGLLKQDNFLNAALKVTTDLPPQELLSFLKSTEQKLGRKKTKRWGPRLIDIDILLYANEKITENNLQIPHVELTRRAFVLVPLRDIYPSEKLFDKSFAKLIKDTHDEKKVWQIAEDW